MNKNKKRINFDQIVKFIYLLIVRLLENENTA